MTDFPEIMSTRQAAAFLGVCPEWLEIHRFDGEGPPFARVGKLCKYRRSSLEAWLAERERTHAGEGV